MKRIISLLLVIAAIFAFVSCGTPTECTSHKDDDNNGICDVEGCGASVEKKPDPEMFTINYEVTVTDAEGNGIEGAVVVINSKFEPSEEVSTNANGKATLKLELEEDPGYFKAYAVVKSVPDGYEIPDRVLIEEGKATVVLEEAILPTEFTVKLVAADGTAVKLAGVNVQICQSTCLEAGATDANGELKKSFVPEEAVFKIKLTNLETLGYTYVSALTDGYVVFDADKTVFEIVVRAL